MLAVATAWHYWSDQPAAIPCGSHTAQPPYSSGSGAGAWEGLTGAALKGESSQRGRNHIRTRRKQNHICGRGSASKEGVPGILEGLLTLHLA